MRSIHPNIPLRPSRQALPCGRGPFRNKVLSARWSQPRSDRLSYRGYASDMPRSRPSSS